MLLSYRIAPSQWKPDAAFHRLLSVLRAHRPAVDGILLFTEETGVAYTPLEQVAEGAVVLKERIAALRAAGVKRVDINVLATLGHWDLPAGLMPAMPFQAMVGHDGQVSTSCACPNSLAFRAYCRERYATVAAAGADVVWVDDDLRLSHHGPTYPCFCPLCLAVFGHGLDREALVAQLNAPENGALRREWSDFGAASVESLCAEIRQGVREASPGAEIGLMTIGHSHSTYGGYPITRWMHALGAQHGRPGHGYYSDQTPRALLNKALDVGRQVRDYPPEAQGDIQYELENYPYITLDKAARTVLNECAAALAMGCNGIAFNALRPGAPDDYEPLMKAIEGERPVWEALLEGAQGLPLVGLWPADHRELMARREVDERGWFWEGGPYDMQRPNALAEMGIPLTTDPRTSCGVVIAGRVAEAFDDGELRDMLSRGVWMDGEALNVLWARGLGQLAGVRPGEPLPGGVAEKLTAHPLNGDGAGDLRDALVGPGDHTCALTPVAEGVGDLAHLAFYDGTDRGCCLSTYTNDLGGRVVVSSYAPWQRLGRAAKRRQLLALADWLAGGRLPVILSQTARVAPLVRLGDDGKRVVALLLNMGFDPTGPLTLRLRAKPAEVSLNARGCPIALNAERQGDETVVRVPSIPAWQTALIVGQ